jgi:hypothetical protein
MMTSFDQEEMMPSSSNSFSNDRIIFDIDPFKESLEHISRNDNETIAEITIDEDGSSVYYKPLPTSASLNRISTSSSSCSSSGSSVSFSEDITEPKKPRLPAMEAVIRNLGIIQQQQQQQQQNNTTTKKFLPTSNKKQINTDTVKYSLETPVPIEIYSSSISQDVNIKDIPVNHLGPREQEEAGIYRINSYI